MFYVPNLITISMSAKYTHEKMRELAFVHFGKIPLKRVNAPFYQEPKPFNAENLGKIFMSKSNSKSLGVSFFLSDFTFAVSSGIEST
jgi:hypothetical protein